MFQHFASAVQVRPLVALGRCACIAIAGLIALHGLATAQNLQFNAAINAGAEVPPTPSSATGRGSFLLNTGTNMLSYNISFTPLGSPETAAHIHCCAPPGVNAGVLFPLPLGSPKVGAVGPLSAAQVASLTSGLMYVNIHSVAFPGGEIRGQILSDDVLAGSDFLFSPDPGCSLKDFASTPIPNGFFGPGSDPFTAAVAFQGAPLTGTNLPPGVDTIVARLDRAILPTCPSSDTIPIEIVALSLVSYQDMTATFGGGGSPTTYSVTACLSSAMAQPVGSMTIQRTHLVGGTFTASLPVTPRLTFTKTSVGGPGLPVIVLDPGPTMNLQTPSPSSVYPGSWAYNGAGFAVPTSPGGNVNHDCSNLSANVPFAPSSNFATGINYPGSTCANNNGPGVIETSIEQSLFARHCFIPVQLPPFNGAFCFCDGSGPTLPPCGNFGAPGHGCRNSSYAVGARLTAAGSPSVSSDSSSLHVNFMSGATVIFLAGNPAIVPVVFGDGLRCIGGNLLRLGVKVFSNGYSSYPQLGDPSIFARATTLGDVIGAGQQRFYQAWHRDAVQLFCPPANFNISNGYQFVWQN